MKIFPNHFTTHDGLTLHCYAEQPTTQPPQANIILVHGLGDHAHALPYHNLRRSLTAHPFAVYSFDMRGHGQSEGPRMFAQNGHLLRDDLHHFLNLVQNEAPGNPIFLIGISLGGLLALNYAQHHPNSLRGLIAVAPAVDASGVPPVIKRLIPLLSRLLPRLSINPGLDLTRISRDTAAAQVYTSDRYFQTRTTPRLAAEMLTAMAETCAQASRLNVPLLMLHGTDDTIVPPAGAARFFAQVPALDKERLTYEGAYHNLFLERNQAQVFADIVRWLKQHSSDKRSLGL